MRTALLVVLALAPAACNSGGSDGGDLAFLSGDRGSGSVPIPGDTRRAGREGIVVTPTETVSQAELEARRNRSISAAEELWQRAQSIEGTNPESAADLYQDLAEAHPASPRAAEAKFREGRAAYRAHEYPQAFEALQRYMEIAPANPYLAEIEELVYRSGTEYLASIGSGLFSIFRSEEPGYGMLKYVPRTFPNGAYADDALLALGDAYRKEEDTEGWMRSVLAYKLLLLRYPRSPLAARARLGLGACYLARDQGDRWHGGFTELDPREDLPAELEKAALGGEVRSGPGLALEQYEALIADWQARPGYATAEELAQAQRGAAQARERLAVKDQRIAGWYASRGASTAAQTYRQSAADLRGGMPQSPTAPHLVAPRERPAPAEPAPAPPPAPTPPTPSPAATPPAPPPTVMPPPPVTPPAPPPQRPTTPTGPSQPPGATDPVASPSGGLPPPAMRRIPGGAR